MNTMEFKLFPTTTGDALRAEILAAHAERDEFKLRCYQAACVLGCAIESKIVEDGMSFAEAYCRSRAIMQLGSEMAVHLGQTTIEKVIKLTVEASIIIANHYARAEEFRQACSAEALRAKAEGAKGYFCVISQDSNVATVEKMKGDKN